MEAEARMNDLKDRMAEITNTEQNTEKEWKKNNEDSLRDLWDNIKAPTFTLQWSQEEQRERTWENIWIAENFPKRGKEIINQVQEKQSPRQDEPKEEHPKTHSY